MNDAGGHRAGGRVAIVTGAASGIGAAVASRLAATGFKVVLADIDDRGIADLEHRLAAAGAVAMGLCGDVADTADGAGIVRAAVDGFSRIDVLVNAAGILGRPAHLTELADEDFDRVLAVNVRGTWSMMRHAAPLIRDAGGGSIVNLASTAAIRGAPSLLAYSTSKHAIVGLTRSAALELAAWHIRVNAVAPGPTATPMMRAAEEAESGKDPAAARARLVAAIPLGRYATADEVGAVVGFLVSEDARYVTGAVYPVDGGRTAGDSPGRR